MSELIHYASKYYDPQKAHEYYEAHKQLKGRRSTAGLTEEGRNVARNVKENLTSERKQKEAEEKEEYTTEKERLNTRKQELVTAEKEKLKADINAHVHKVQLEVAKLRIVLESGSLKNNPEKRDEVLAQIRTLAEDTNKKRDELVNKFKEDSEKIISDTIKKQEELSAFHNAKISTIREEYDTKYENELDAIRKEYTAQKKSKAASSGKKSKSSTTEEKKTVKKSESTSSTFTPVKKAQTSKWAVNRAKRKEKAKKLSSIQHSDDWFEDRIKNIVNSQQTIDEVMMRNKESDNRIADRDALIHSLLEED